MDLIELPYELVFEMLYTLQVRDILDICRTNRRLSQIWRDDSFWREYLRRYYYIGVLPGEPGTLYTVDPRNLREELEEEGIEGERELALAEANVAIFNESLVGRSREVAMALNAIIQGMIRRNAYPSQRVPQYLLDSYGGLLLDPTVRRNILGDIPISERGFVSVAVLGSETPEGFFRFLDLMPIDGEEYLENLVEEWRLSSIDWGRVEFLSNPGLNVMAQNPVARSFYLAAIEKAIQPLVYYTPTGRTTVQYDADFALLLQENPELLIERTPTPGIPSARIRATNQGWVLIDKTIVAIRGYGDIEYVKLTKAQR